MSGEISLKGKQCLNLAEFVLFLSQNKSLKKNQQIICFHSIILNLPHNYCYEGKNFNHLNHLQI